MRRILRLWTLIFMRPTLIEKRYKRWDRPKMQFTSHFSQRNKSLKMKIVAVLYPGGQAAKEQKAMLGRSTERSGWYCTLDCPLTLCFRLRWKWTWPSWMARIERSYLHCYWRKGAFRQWTWQTFAWYRYSDHHSIPSRLYEWWASGES